MDGLQLLAQGGPVMMILAVLSVTVVALAAFKIYQFAHVRLRKTDFIEELMTELVHGKTEQALEQLAAQKNPSGELLKRTIEACLNPKFSTEDIHAEVGRTGSQIIRELEGSLRVIGAIAQLAPLLGLLGTVLGMIEAFYELQGAGSQVDPALLAGGIWEALLTTAAGLAIAIPAMAILYYLESEVDSIKAVMKDATTRVILLLRPRNDDASVFSEKDPLPKREALRGI